MCPAVYLAEVEIFSALVRMLSKSFIEPVSINEVPNIDGSELIGINLYPLPYKVKFTPRSQVNIS